MRGNYPRGVSGFMLIRSVVRICDSPFIPGNIVSLRIGCVFRHDFGILDNRGIGIGFHWFGVSRFVSRDLDFFSLVIGLGHILGLVGLFCRTFRRL
ncbi:MAG: hypothetical protein HKO14_08455 [Silicimonas sp.]|nr:hypothetical protein [Silicimonas sp.]